MYKIIGSDQKIYGPVSDAQLRQWMAEGRVSLATLAQAEGGSEWKPLSAYPQFAAPPLVPPLALPPRAAADSGNGMAVAGLTLGILSNVCCCFGFLFGALGVVFSAMALTQANAHPQRRGRDMAMAGLVLSIISLLMHSLVPSFFGLLSGWGLLHHHRLWHNF